MVNLKIIEEHQTIRETSGYDLIKAVPLHDVPQVLGFLRIVFNYEKMIKLNNDNT